MRSSPHQKNDCIARGREHGLHRISVTNEEGHHSEAILEIRYGRIRVLPSIGRDKAIVTGSLSTRR